jgi:hypothetical protein
LTYDELKGELLSLDVQPKNNCPVCSVEGGFLGLGDLEPLPDYEGKEKVFPLPDQFETEEPEEKDIDLSPETLSEDLHLPIAMSKEFGHDLEDV